METPLINKKIFNRIRRHLPRKKSRKRMNDRLVISGIFWVIKTGSAWRQLPEFYGKWTTVYSRFKRWSKIGLFEKIFRIFAKRVDKKCFVMIDSSYLKVHRTAASMACEDTDRLIGKSRGGPTSQLHLLCNEFSLPIDFLITGGEVHDAKPAPELIARNKMNGLIADKAYGAAEVRSFLSKHRRKCCIPAKSNAKNKINHDRNIYKKRHRIENMFAKIKDLKGIALRTSRCAYTFTSIVSVALIILFF